MLKTTKIVSWQVRSWKESRWISENRQFQTRCSQSTEKTRNNGLYLLKGVETADSIGYVTYGKFEPYSRLTCQTVLNSIKMRRYVSHFFVRTIKTGHVIPRIGCCKYVIVMLSLIHVKLYMKCFRPIWWCTDVQVNKSISSSSSS